MSDSARRVATLSRYQILDTPPEQIFDDLTKLTTLICGTPIALVTLLDSRRQWFKSARGLPISETPLEHAFCAHAIEQEKIFTVGDATKDERFAENPLVTGNPNIRFYAGAPLVTPEGVPLSTLCAIDRVPRKLTPEQEEGLAALGRQVMWALELRRTGLTLRIALEAQETAEREVATLQDLLPMCAWCRKVRDEESFWHDVEEYLVKHANTRISHGVCPACAAKVREEMRGRRASAN